MDDIMKVYEAIGLFQWIAKNRLARFGVKPATLRDNGPTEPLRLDGDPPYEYPPTDVETLYELGFLQGDRGYFKLTDKAGRLVEALKAREDEMPGPLLDWVIVADCGLFIDQGSRPPNLSVLMGEEWEPGDRIVITCHDPEYLLVSHLPLALAGCDPLFETDMREVAADFK
ncbi:MAG: hypothetical protein AABO41_20230 [Acidobacteriota bacterium]